MEPYSQKSNHKAKRFSKVVGSKLIRIYTGDTVKKAMRDVWEVSIINSQSEERIGYPMQKPEALLERIIKASSNPGDTVLDAFVGGGTTAAVARRLGRKFVGIDQSVSELKHYLLQVLTSIKIKLKKLNTVRNKQKVYHSPIPIVV